MYFRFRGNNIQVVRTVTDQATGKAKSVPVGSINKANLRVSDNLAKACSTAELAEIESWVVRQRSRDILKQEHAAVTLPEQMALAAEWFGTTNSEDTQLLADDIVVAWVDLRTSINKLLRA